ncbi:MAG: hypothetical protein JRJ77_18305 [Deltaproteobacteria bacterium]|nr:hypothetical protein [Deltaproteobacteria bacterium]
MGEEQISEEMGAGLWDTGDSDSQFNGWWKPAKPSFDKHQSLLHSKVVDADPWALNTPAPVITELTGPGQADRPFSRKLKNRNLFTDVLLFLCHYAYDTHGTLTSVTDGNGNTTSYTYDDTGRLVSTTSPGTGAVTYVYEEAGNLGTKTDAK